MRVPVGVASRSCAGLRSLALMAEGCSNAAITRQLVVSASAVEKHIGNIFAKLGLLPDDAQRRRVLAGRVR